MRVWGGEGGWVDKGCVEDGWRRGRIDGWMYTKEDVRREDIAQESVLVANERQRLCELGLRVGVVLEGLGRGGTHGGSGGLLGGDSGGLLLECAEERTH